MDNITETTEDENDLIVVQDPDTDEGRVDESGTEDASDEPATEAADSTADASSSGE